MSRRLFTYRDLVRIHAAITPDRAPGPAAIEFAQITLLIGDLVQDGIDAVQEATRLGVFTVPRDLMIDLTQKFFRFIWNVRRRNIDDVADLIQEALDGEGFGRQILEQVLRVRDGVSS